MIERQWTGTPDTVIEVGPITKDGLVEIIDLTEMVADDLVGWSLLERTRWENDGGSTNDIFDLDEQIKRYDQLREVLQ